MFRGNTAILALRFICALCMAFGLMMMIYGILYRYTIPLFAFDVPTWVIGATVVYLGLRHWRRVPELEKSVTPLARFSWKNFTLFRWR